MHTTQFVPPSSLKQDHIAGILSASIIAECAGSVHRGLVTRRSTGHRSNETRKTLERRQRIRTRVGSVNHAARLKRVKTNGSAKQLHKESSTKRTGAIAIALTLGKKQRATESLAEANSCVDGASTPIEKKAVRPVRLALTSVARFHETDDAPMPRSR